MKSFREIVDESCSGSSGCEGLPSCVESHGNPRVPVRRAIRTLGNYLILTKPRVMELLLVTTAPTMILAHDGMPGLGLLILTLIGGALSAASASAFNMYIDRDVDALMARTEARPLVTGAISPRAGLIFAWLLAGLSSAFFWTFVSTLAAALSACAIIWYVVVYTLLLKRRTTQNIVWGGLAGCFPVLIAWASVTGTVSWTALILFLVVFFWTPAHYWPLSIRYGEDYRRANIPMLGAVRASHPVAVRVLMYAGATVFCSFALIPVAQMGVVYSVSALIGGGWFVAHAARYVVATSGQGAGKPMQVFLASNIYLGFLFVAVAADTLLQLQ
ncbi:heme o synthase (plasmid) [Rhodococcus globerulus]|uniref:heme o synthase n=1 Tax=Rhodococcus globerulus TaxID=33008 RepID=UPI0039E83CC7